MSVARRCVSGVFWLHRWLGVAMGLLMLVWCLSGFVMLYVLYPQFDDGRDGSGRLGALPELRVAAPRLPDAAGVAQQPVDVTVEMLDTIPVLRVRGTIGPESAYALDTGQPMGGIDAGRASAIAATYLTRLGLAAVPQPPVQLLRDQWTVSGAFDVDRPLWRVALGDAAGTMLYVSGSSGRIVQRTVRTQRFWNWLGAVPHWLYFTSLRSDPATWSAIVVWTSLAGAVLAALGLYVGVRQLWHARRGGRYSPYRGFLWWHHLPALAFGVLVLTWVFSGLASMQPWGWFEGSGGDPRPRVRGAPPSWPAVSASLSRVLDGVPPGTVQLAMSPFDGRIAWLATRSDGHRVRLDEAGQRAPFAPRDAARAAELLGAAAPERLTHEDDFHYSGPGGRVAQLPVWRAIAADGSRTRFYLDEVSGEVLSMHAPAERAYRWWHVGLHRLDFSGALRSRPLWDVVMWLGLAGATFVCATGAWLGVLRLLGRPWRDRPAQTGVQSREARSD